MTTETKHTDQGWIISLKPRHDEIAVTTNDGTIIAMVWGLNQDIRHNHAALIAAAPKMLETLKKIVTNAIECPMDSGPSLVDGVTWDMINEAKKTIRLAEGKP